MEKKEADHPVGLEDLEKELTGWKDPPARLLKALQNDELVLFAQPIVAIDDRRSIPMAEVLIRMREEEDALLPPGMFLSVFEYCGMLHELDRWVARQAVRRLAKGSRVPCLSINVSAQTLGDREFVRDVTAELTRAGLPVHSIAFEISEEAMVSLPASAKEFAAAARSSGFPLILDSFGSDAASLAPLIALNVNYVKIDGVIVRSLDKSPMARKKLGAVIQVGRLTGVQLIGECVETDTALAHLQAEGVRYAQGFGIGAPAPIDEVV